MTKEMMGDSVCMNEAVRYREKIEELASYGEWLLEQRQDSIDDNDPVGVADVDEQIRLNETELQEVRDALEALEP